LQKKKKQRNAAFLFTFSSSSFVFSVQTPTLSLSLTFSFSKCCFEVLFVFCSQVLEPLESNSSSSSLFSGVRLCSASPTTLRVEQEARCPENVFESFRVPFGFFLFFRLLRLLLHAPRSSSFQFFFFLFTSSFLFCKMASSPLSSLPRLSTSSSSSFLLVILFSFCLLHAINPSVRSEVNAAAVTPDQDLWEAVGDSGDITLQLEKGTYHFAEEILVENGRTVVLKGVSKEETILDCQQKSRAFHVTKGATLIFSDMTVMECNNTMVYNGFPFSFLLFLRLLVCCCACSHTASQFAFLILLFSLLFFSFLFFLVLTLL
jgi:hypothetical protein